MDKEKITKVLQATLFLINGISALELLTKYGFDVKTVIKAQEIIKELDVW